MQPRRHDAGVVVIIMVHCKIVPRFVRHENTAGGRGGSETNIVDTSLDTNVGKTKLQNTRNETKYYRFYIGFYGLGVVFDVEFSFEIRFS